MHGQPNINQRNVVQFLVGARDFSLRRQTCSIHYTAGYVDPRASHDDADKRNTHTET